MKNLGIIELVIAAALILVVSCKKNKSAQSSEVDQKEEVIKKSKEQSTVPSVEVDQTYVHNTTDSFTLLESNLSGDVIELLVQYGGGCEEHGWRLVTNGAYAKSMPPQITLSLEHNANGDMCRALLRDTLEFNLKEIRYPGSFNLMVKIQDYEKQSIMYTY
ncbi:MAG: hypothetical protein AB8B53_01630 [Flavobacteriales bacterium]